jgi:hypothetical protein
MELKRKTLDVQRMGWRMWSQEEMCVRRVYTFLGINGLLAYVTEETIPDRLVINQ